MELIVLLDREIVSRKLTQESRKKLDQHEDDNSIRKLCPSIEDKVMGVTSSGNNNEFIN